MFGNLLKAAVAAVVTPIALAADVMMLPDSAYNDKHPFDKTKKTLKQASDALDAAVKPNADVD